jgi:hypothetical protein
MFDLDFSDDLTKLNFIGVVSLFGGEIALSALRYTVLIRSVFLSLYFTMVLSPGLQTVSLKMFKQMEDRVSRAISGGPRDDKKDIIGLSSSNSYKYVGVHSATNMPITSILGEALIRTCEDEHPTEVVCSRPESPERNLSLKVVEIAQLEKVETGNLMHVKSQRFGYRSVLLYTIPLITIAGVIIVLLAEDYMAFALILLNILCNMSVTFTVRSNGVKYPDGHSAGDSPPGDIFVETRDGKETYLVIGDENIIQYIFQKPLVMPPGPDNKMWNYLHMAAAYVSYIMVIVNIILLPFSTIGGQLIFGLLIFFGVVQNILLSTFDGDKLLLDMIERRFKVGSTKEYIFQTRSSVIAFCMLRSKPKTVGPLRDLLPSTPIFDSWFENVMKTVDGIVPTDDSAVGLLKTLNIDLKDAFNVYKPLVINVVDELKVMDV